MKCQNMIKLVEAVILAILMLITLSYVNDMDTEQPITISNNYIIYVSDNAPEIEITQEYVYCQPKHIRSTVYEIPPYPGMKKWMGYKSFSRGSKQHKLQQYCITDSFGLRGVDGLYCIAIGSHFGTEIGQRIDLVLENGTVIPCVMGDQKADVHTDQSNIFSNTTKNLCCSEFIVDSNKLKSEATYRGDTSFVCDIWKSPVSKIVVYDINILEELEEGQYETETDNA